MKPETTVARVAETILLIEDEDAVRDVLRQTLEREGYVVVAAAGAPRDLHLGRRPGPDRAGAGRCVVPSEAVCAAGPGPAPAGAARPPEHAADAIANPQFRGRRNPTPASSRGKSARSLTATRYNCSRRPGDREPKRTGFEESPDTVGQDAGEIPGGESRRKVAQKGDRQRRTNSPETPVVRVKGWGKSPPAPW